MAHPTSNEAPEAGSAPVADTLSRFEQFIEETDKPQDDAAVDAAPTGDEPIEAEDAPQEAEAADDANEEGEEQAAAPAIPPPVSWTAEEKATFAELPPELQQRVAERESQRERFVQSKATEAAEAKRAIAAYEAHVVTLQSQYAQGLQQFLGSEDPLKPDPAWLDVSTYGVEGPEAFYRQQQAYEAAIAQRQQAQHELQSISRQQQQQEAQSRAAYDAEQNRILAEALPGWVAPETRGELQKGIALVASELGYTPERMAEVDATDVLALHKALTWKDKAAKYDALQKSKMATVRDAQGLPKVMKPGAPSPKGSAAAERFHQEREHLRKTGKPRDAAALFSAFV